MSFKEQKERLQDLEHWFFSEQGKTVANEFARELIKIPAKNSIGGQVMLQLGNSGFNFLEQFKFEDRWLITPYECKKTALVSQFSNLPFNEASIDCIISPLIVDAYYYRPDLIDEFDRILKPGGTIIFLGINPLSVWGLWLKRAKFTCYGKFNCFPKSAFSLKKFLQKRNYIHIYSSSFYYIPPIKSRKLSTKWLIFNNFGKIFFAPLPAGFYCLVMQKISLNSDVMVNAQFSNHYEELDIELQPTCLSDHKL